MKTRALLWVLSVLGGVLGLLFVIALCLGPITLTPADVLHGLGGGAGVAHVIVHEIRLPRALLAVLIGSGLGMAGAALQALLRNPLAEPGVIGVSAGSALGAVVAFYSGLSAQYALALPLAGCAGAMMTTLILYAFTRRTLDTSGLILAGVAINSLGGALTALLLNLSPNPYAVYEIVFWLMGSLADRSNVHVMLVAPFILTGMGLLIYAAPHLDSLVLGEETAQSLGVNLRRLRRWVIVGVALAVGPGVAVAGIIGFIGLLVPHLLRPLVTHRPSALLPASALGGAVMTLTADNLIRLFAGAGELKLGVLTALIGAPLFLIIALRAPGFRS